MRNIAVVLHVAQFGFTQPDGTAIIGYVEIQLEGQAGTLGAGGMNIPFGLSYPDLVSFLKTKVTDALLTFYSITLDPATTAWQFFGLPAPTLADLGG